MTRIERLYAYNTIEFYLNNCCNCLDDLLDKFDDDMIREIIYIILDSDEMNEE